MNRPNTMHAAPIATPIGGATPATGSKLTPVDPMRVLMEYIWVFVLTGVVGLVLGVGLYFVLTKFMPQYKSQAVVEIGSEITNVMDPTRERPEQAEAYERFQRTQAMRMRGPGVLLNVLQRDDVKQTQWYQAHANDTPAERLRLLEKRVSVNPVRESQYVTIQVTMSAKGDPAIVANNIVDEYLEQYRQDLRSGRSVEAEAYNAQRTQLIGDIGRLQDQVDQIVRLADISVVKTNYHEIDAQFQELVQQQSTLSSVLVAAQESLQAMLAEREAGTVEFNATDQLSVDNDPEVRRWTSIINSSERDRRSALLKYGEDHPVIIQIEKDIAAAEGLRDEVRQELLLQLQDAKISDAERNASSLAAQFAAGAEKLEDLRVKRRELTKNIQEYQQLTMQIDDLQAKLNHTQEQLDRIEIERSHPGTIRVTRQESARIPERPSFPPPVYITAPMTSVGLTLLVLGLVFLKEMLDSRIKSPSCSKLLPRNDLLGVIPDLEEDPDGVSSMDLIVMRHPTGLMAETIRQMRIELQRKVDERRYKTMMVTGCQPGSGVSTVATNLAANLAANGRRVLVVEANFRRPALGRILGVEASVGLADLLAGEASLSDVIQPTGVPGMDVVLIGNQSNTVLERLESDAFSRALRDLEQEYDLVLVDAPPLSIVSDARLLGDRVQSVLLVARAMQEKRGLVARLINQLNDSRAEFIGLVINGVRTSAGGYFRRNFKAFYSYQNGSMSHLTESSNGGVRMTADEDQPVG